MSESRTITSQLNKMCVNVGPEVEGGMDQGHGFEKAALENSGR